MEIHHSGQEPLNCTLDKGQVVAGILCAVSWLVHSEISESEILRLVYLMLQLDIEGSLTERCISSMIYSRGTPFWSETLDMVMCFNSVSMGLDL